MSTSTNSFLLNVRKSKAESKNLKDFSSGIFIDNSGSTSSHLPTTNRSIIQSELSLCQLKKFDHIVVWDTKATLCRDLSRLPSQGGTDPTSIFTNPKTKSAFDASDVVVFVTDGEIPGESVTRLGKLTENQLSKALIICVIVNKRLGSPAQINISVVAPLMMASNVLCLFYDGKTFFNLSSKGHISQFYPSSTQLDRYENLNTVNLAELFDNVRLCGYEKLPEGFFPLRETADEIIAMNFNEFLRQNDRTSLLNLSEDDWKTIIQYGKISNKLTEIRSFLSRMKNDAIQEEKTKSRQTFDLTYSKQRDALIERIVQLKFSENETSADDLKLLRQQLSDVTDRANLEELNYLKYFKTNLHGTRQFWNKIESFLFEQEKGSFSLNDFNFSSNRANRAKLLTDDDDEDMNEDEQNLLDHSNVPQIECSICMEQGPFVLWLKSPADLDSSTNDFILNFPLQGDEKLLSCFVSNPVCGFCAKSFVVVTKRNNADRLMTLYREDCEGFIPGNWSNESNRRFAYRSLCRILTANRMLNHVSMLLLAMIDDFRSNWFDDEIRKFLLDEISKNLLTTETFSEEGTKMKFIDALKLVEQQTANLLRQPIKAFCRIWKFASMFHQIDRNSLIMALRKRFCLLALEKQCSISKHSQQHLIDFQQEMIEILFETTCGIPTENSLKKIDFFHEDFQRTFEPSHRHLFESFSQLAEQIPLEISTTFPSEFITFVLYILTRVAIHDRPMKLFNDFSSKHRILRDQIDLNWNEINDKIHRDFFGQYFSLKNNLTPSFAVNLGGHSCPSKFFFGDQPLCSKTIENQRISLEILIQQIKEKLDENLQEVFGRVNPNENSGHVSIHRIVAETLENEFPNEDELNIEMIRQCFLRLAQTRGRAGNIYAQCIFAETVVLIEDFLKFRRRTKNFEVENDENTTRSFRHKVLSELLNVGMNFDAERDEIFFEPSKLLRPRLLRPEESTFDFDQLKKLVQENYLATKKKSEAKSNCINVEIKEFIEFAFAMDAEQLLPIWAEEQKKIVSSIVTHEDQIDEPIRFIAGLDISFVKTNDQAVASMVIFDYPTLNIVAKISVNCRMKIPYIPSFLAFREAPVFMKLIDIQREYCSHLTPQVILIDGNGVWHPRRVGIASHFGVLSGIPCFGVTKNVLVADGINREKIEELLKEKSPNENEYFEVIGDSGEVLGLAYNVTGAIKNAVYISVGHKITLPTALKIFENVTKYRICEPIRQADLLSREMVTKLN